VPYRCIYTFTKLAEQPEEQSMLLWHLWRFASTTICRKQGKQAGWRRNRCRTSSAPQQSNGPTRPLLAHQQCLILRGRSHHFYAFSCLIQMCYLLRKFTLRTCNSMTKTIVYLARIGRQAKKGGRNVTTHA